ncbi:MAG: tetratricopeptide repeat protein [Pyrinomonadaceae bacterium]
MKPVRILLLALLSAGIALAAVRPTIAKDEWIQVRSKNFFLIGNGSEKDIRKVGTRLEQFRETFRLLFKNTNLTSPIPTNVVVFKSDSSYKNFKPKRADGKIDTFVAGYFQPGEDVNYITLSTEGEAAEVYQTIFHEYVHFIVDTNFGKSEVPAWFNEGLAEYYATFEIEDNQKLKLGLPQGNHVDLLQQNKLMPLDQLFGVSNSQLLQTGNHSRNIFYAQSWALIHYLMQGGKSDGLGKFLTFLLQNVPAERAFQDAFQTDYKSMENELRKYVGKRSFQYTIFTLTNKMIFDADMQVLRLTEAESNAYLGDLLYHSNRVDDAEPFLIKSLNLDSTSSMANTALGMVKVKQRKFGEAKPFLEKAISVDQKNHNAFYQYAYLLSREGRDEFGFVQRFDAANAAKMREALRRAIAINPAFTESYELLAFVALVNNDELDDAVKQLRSALRYQPGNQRYAIRLAEILLRQKNYSEANAIAEKIARTADDSGIKGRADDLVSRIATYRDYEGRKSAEMKRLEALAANSGSTLGRSESSKPLTEAEVARQQEISRLRSLNEALYRNADGEQRSIGRVQKIECRSKQVFFTVKTDSETFTVMSKDFESLLLKALDPAAVDISIGCDAKLAQFTAVLTYKNLSSPRSGIRGELIAVDFVPPDFRFLSAEEMKGATYIVYGQPGDGPRPPSDPQRPSTINENMPPDLEARRRNAIIQALREAVRKPLDGEKSDIGYLEKLECSSKKIFFHIRTADGVVKLLNSSPESVKITFYTPDLGGLQIGCGMKPVEFPAVFNYTDKPDAKNKIAGEIVSLEFMPKTFTLVP